MKVLLNVSEDNAEAKILVNVPKRTVFFENLFLKIKRLLHEQQVNVEQDGEFYTFEVNGIERVFTEKKSVFCQVNGKKYRIKKYIYEIADLLPSDSFFQISQSEIVNQHFVCKFSLTKTGLYQVVLKDGSYTYASRRYMYKIKKEYFK